ncbi:hypothetical protein BDM02DRAFT_3121491 [Thelephora ganbajun]|uniref:Uncharacterized protein n=1 Tax=Thelephora ganbajun TaxID=370292 RepID=A0ACB6Z5P8_THEGA|nr:hypothetical protein BDM02DRAFT_3121491 [Thelephora ganbajun]
MPLSPPQITAANEVINILCSAPAGPRAKRKLGEMFMDLVDKDDLPEYYEVIQDPKCLNGVLADLKANRFKDAQAVYDDLNLIFLNALHYNREDSQIAKDANTLKGILEAEWARRQVLPPPSHQTSVNQRRASSEVDIDGGMSESEPTNETSRVPQSDEIVKQLEKSVPRWEGFGPGGWSTAIQLADALPIVEQLRDYKDTIGTRLSTILDTVPDMDSKLNFPQVRPLSLKLIETRLRAGEYENPQKFDREVHELFLKARRFHEAGSDVYGGVLILQRFYQALTSPNPPSGPPYKTATNWASLPAGPGTARPLNAAEGEASRAVTTFRVSTKDRKFVEEVEYRGWKIRVADWLHLCNPDDPSKPIIGQVFKCYQLEEPARMGQLGVTVCWYYRPEQTIHPPHRQFWEGEVFKTSHFADHPLDDIIEKIACQFTARHIRGRPRPPVWYPGFPLYVCDSRYNDRERIFVKIKNWNSCVPEEVRKSADFMPIYSFEAPVFPRRYPSPFLTGGRGTGGLGESVEKAEGDKHEGGGIGRKRPRKGAAGANTVTQTDYAGPSRGVYVGPPTPATGAASTSLLNIPLTATTSTAAGSTPVYQYQSSLTSQPQRTLSSQGGKANEDRSILAAIGGLSVVGSQNVILEKLPPETAKHFDRDPQTNEVLWFASPPVDVAPPVQKPRHSFAYLNHLAKKRKLEREKDEDEDAREGEDSGMNLDTEEPSDGSAVARPKMSIDEAWQQAVAQFS